MERYDVVIIGGGPGGYVAAIRAGQLGLRTALVEKEAVGGVCLNWGCIPSKAILRNAEVVHLIRRGERFGISYDNLRLDVAAAIDRSRTVVDRMVQGVEFLLGKHGVTLYRGEGYLHDRTKVEVRPDGTELEADHIIVATGASLRSLPGVEVDGKTVLTSREALELRTLPRSAVIIGGGPQGVEFAYFWRAYGVEVTVVELLPHLVPGEDEEVSRSLERAFTAQGIGVRTGARVQAVQRRRNRVAVQVEAGADGAGPLEADLVLLAVGVRANTEGFGLERLGVALENGFVKVDGRMRTNVPGVYAIGDVTGPPLLAHVASAQGEVAVEDIAGLAPPALKYDDMPRATYCQPQVASWGLTERQAKERGYEVRVGKFPMRANGKALAIDETEGFVKVVADARYGEILGVHMIGPDVTELLSELSVAKALEATYLEVGRTVHPHPTLAETVREAALAVTNEAIHFWTGTPSRAPKEAVR
ncbi:MAG TPA: dihydrolipoyl dehydrogenase [Dehalococcoidia bacterium]